MDATIILLAAGSNEELLSNDYRLHMVAKTKGAKSKWLTTIILECAQKNILQKQATKDLLLELVKAGMYLNAEVYSLMQKKIDEM